MNYFVRNTRQGRAVVIDAPAVALCYVLHQIVSAEEPNLHRTPVSTMQGDVLDALELEMANDALVARATEKVSAVTSTVGAWIEDSLVSQTDLVIPWDDQERVQEFLQWANRVYTHLRQAETEGFIIGMPQDESNELGLSDQDDFGMLFVASMVSEIANTIFEES